MASAVSSATPAQAGFMRDIDTYIGVHESNKAAQKAQLWKSWHEKVYHAIQAQVDAQLGICTKQHQIAPAPAPTPATTPSPSPAPHRADIYITLTARMPSPYRWTRSSVGSRPTNSANDATC